MSNSTENQIRKAERSFFEKLGQAVYKKRSELNLSQQDLSDQCFIDLIVISKLESGEANLPLESLLKIVHRLGLTLKIALEDEHTKTILM